MTFLDDFALELLTLAYEFDRYFPGLLEDQTMSYTLEHVLPARIAAAREGLEGIEDLEPFKEFLQGQVAEARDLLADSDDLEEATDAFVQASDALYHWLRRYDCVAPEQTALSILLCYVESVLMVQGEGDGAWCLPHGICQDGEGVEEAAVRIIAEVTNLDLDESALGEIVAQSYVYDGTLQHLIYLQADCSRQPALPSRCHVADWEKLPLPELERLLAGWRASTNEVAVPV